MRVDEILRQSGLQKGAFYHHFGSKTELGYAVLEEQIKPLLESIWIQPLVEIDDPLRDIPRMLATLASRIPDTWREHGCPLNNLAQEMSAQDDGFRERIDGIFDSWIAAFSTVFEQAKLNGYVRHDVDSHAVSRFLIAALEGCIGISKVKNTPQQWAACQSQIATYLGALRPLDRMQTTSVTQPPAAR